MACACPREVAFHEVDCTVQETFNIVSTYHRKSLIGCKAEKSEGTINVIPLHGFNVLVSLDEPLGKLKVDQEDLVFEFS
jgi:hypothetical protein